VLIDHLAAVDAAKAAPAEMEDAGDPAAVWADNEAPLEGGPGVAGDCLHGPRGQGSGVRGQGSATAIPMGLVPALMD
jgi:hypothetical protein